MRALLASGMCHAHEGSALFPTMRARAGIFQDVSLDTAPALPSCLCLGEVRTAHEGGEGAMATFEKCFNMKGFDRGRVPRWQMVPKDGDRYVALRGGGALVHVFSEDPSICTVTEIELAALDSVPGERMPLAAGDRVFHLRGVKKGRTFIKALDAERNGGVELEVGVKERKTVKVTFNFVRDSAGHSTQRAPASARGWVSTMNYIYNGQANIYFRLMHARWVTATQDLGASVTWTPGPGKEWDIVAALGDATADLNYFLVWDYWQSGDDATSDTDAGTLSGVCLFEDNAGVHVGTTMAHEAGHHLGCDDFDDGARQPFLMFGTTDARGMHLSRDEVNIMNP